MVFYRFKVRLVWYVIIVLSMAIVACTNSQKSQQMAELLQQAEQQNQNYINFTSDSLMKEVVKYYDCYGTTNEQIRAHYMLGCVYRDLRDAPMALQCYQDAVGKADTTSMDCDFGLLCRIHSQMASLFHYQYLPRNELNEIKQACHFAMLAHDTITALRCYEHQANAYGQLLMADSVIYYSQRAAERYLEIGDTASANSALAASIHTYMQRGEYDVAEKLLDRLEVKSNVFTQPNFKAHNYYNNRALLNIYKENYPNAKKYLYMALESSDNINALDYTYKNLCLLYRKTGETDSLAKYSILYCANNDSTIAYMSTAIVERMQSLYNYNRSLQAAKRAEIERNIAQNRNQMLVAALLTLFLLAVSIIMILRSRKNKVINKKIQEIELLQNTIAQLEDKDLSPTDQLGAFEESNIIQSLLQKAHNSEKAGLAELNELKETAKRLLPHFIQTLDQTDYKLQSHETHLCILIKAGFHPSEIASLLSMSPQNISNLRARLNKKMFNTDKGAKDFNERIINLTEGK